MADEQINDPQQQPETPDDATEGTQPDGGNTGRTYTQDELEAIIEDRLGRERAQREKAAERARREAQEKALEEQQQYRELSEQQKARIAELEPLEAQVERLTATLRAQVDAQRADLPEHITALLDRLDPVEQLEWLAANREQLVARPANGVPPTPRGAGQPSREDLIRQEIEAQRQRRFGR